jgi:hypothetical protein
LPFAVTPFGEVISHDWSVDTNMLLAGMSGSGKSIAAQVLVTGALIQHHEVHVIDAKRGVDFAYARPWLTSLATTIDEAEATLLLVHARMLSTNALNAVHGTRDYSRLPEAVRPKRVYLVIDQFTNFLDLPGAGLSAVERAKVQHIGTLIGQIAREGRSAGVSMLIAAQILTGPILNRISADFQALFSARVMFGSITYMDRMATFAEGTGTPDLGIKMPRGRGLAEVAGRKAQVIQAWNGGLDSGESMALVLTRLLGPECEPALLDVHR